MTVMQIGAVRPGMEADGAMQSVMGQLNFARETAISQRRLVEIAFTNAAVSQTDMGGRVRVTRRELPNGTKLLADVPFEGGVLFGCGPECADTPDGFGNSQPINFGAAVTVMFNTEGMLVDSGGMPMNGTVFILIPNQPGSFRAVTVLGSTGRVRGFRWNGGQWTRV